MPDPASANQIEEEAAQTSAAPFSADGEARPAFDGTQDVASAAADAAFPRSAAEPAQADAASAPAAGNDDDRRALDELQNLLLGRERRNIQRLESAVTGFISSVIRDESLDSLVSQAVEQAISRHLPRLKAEMERAATAAVAETTERELAVVRGRLAERIEVPVDDAIRERIAISGKYIAEALNPVYGEILSGFIEDGRHQIDSALYPEVAEAIDRRITEERPKVESYIAATIEEILGEGLRSAAGTHILHMADRVGREASLRNRRVTWIVGLAAAGILALCGFYLWRISTRLDAQEETLKALRKTATPAAAAPSPAAPVSIQTAPAVPARIGSQPGR